MLDAGAECVFEGKDFFLRVLADGRFLGFSNADSPWGGAERPAGDSDLERPPADQPAALELALERQEWEEQEGRKRPNLAIRLCPLRR